MKNCIIRKATLSDLDSMFELWLEMQSSHNKFDKKWYQPDFTDKCKPKCIGYWSNLIKDKNRGIYLAELNEIIIGMAISHIVNRPPVLLNQIKVLEIENVIVKKKFRNNGVFKKLMAKTILFGKNNNAKALHLTVNHKNKIAIKAYKSIGLKESEFGMLKYLK